MPFVALNGQDLWFEDSGGTGMPLILGHGFLMDSRMFDPLVEALAPGVRVIRWDARGFGRTRWDGKPFSLYDSAADCVGLLDHLGIARAVVGGMSQGGYCALRVALRHPERVRALVLISTRGTVDSEEVKESYRQLAQAWSTQGPIEPVLQGLAAGIIGSPAHQEPWLERWRAIPGDHFAAAIHTLVDRDDLQGQLGTIRSPAIVFHGLADAGIPPAEGERLHASLPGSTEFVPIPEAGHCAVLTHTGAVVPPLRRFLRSLEG